MSNPETEDSSVPGVWADSQMSRPVTPSDVMSMLREIRDKLADLERDLVDHQTAFVKDDLGQPDFHGHRKAHIKMNTNQKLVESYKADVTKQILGALVVFLLGIFASGWKDSLTGNSGNQTTKVVVQPATK